MIFSWQCQKCGKMNDNEFSGKCHHCGSLDEEPKKSTRKPKKPKAITMSQINLSNKIIDVLIQMQVDGVDDNEAVAILWSGIGHSGEGVYVASSEYPEEGCVFLGPQPK